MKFSVGSTVELDIEKLVVGGDGLARKDGAVFFVPLSAPGDRIQARILEDKKTFYRAEIVAFLEKSPLRVNPLCPYFGTCGGCSWQHLSAETQLKAKESLVFENLQKFLKQEKLPFLGIVPSPKEWRYRNRIQPQILNKEDGFQAAKTHQVVPVEDCLITDENLIRLWPELKRSSLGRSSPERVELYLNQKNQAQWYSMAERKEDLGFSQVNEGVNQLLIQKILDWSSDYTGERIIDLYAGAGNLTFPLSSA